MRDGSNTFGNIANRQLDRQTMDKRSDRQTEMFFFYKMSTHSHFIQITFSKVLTGYLCDVKKQYTCCREKNC